MHLVVTNYIFSSLIMEIWSGEIHILHTARYDQYRRMNVEKTAFPKHLPASHRKGDQASEKSKHPSLFMFCLALSLIFGIL